MIMFILIKKYPIIDPKNDTILKTTGEVNTVISMGFNTRKAAVEKVIRKKVKPLFR